MKEDFLHYCWKYKRFQNFNFQTTSGEPIAIIETGFHNHNAGPDFLDAKLLIGDKLWAGHVEIHVNSSDWNKHQHQTDKHYDAVVLHVVYHHDKEVHNTKGGLLPVLCLAPYIEEGLYQQYLYFVRPALPCQTELKTLNPLITIQFKDELFFERLARKSILIKNRLAETKHNWEQCFYESLTKSLGMKTNALAFETLAKLTPFSILLKSNQLEQIEAILFGNSGLLVDRENGYIQQLQKEYQFQQAKHGFVPMPVTHWKFSKLRPSNFPTVRIAQLAKLIAKTQHLFHQLVKNKPSLSTIHDLLSISITAGFWHTHFTFNKEGKQQVKSTGKTLVNSIIINTIVPFMYAYGKAKADDSYKEHIYTLLTALPPENNKTTRLFKNLTLTHAIDSQAVIEAYSNYCTHKKCLSCTIGTSILRGGVDYP